mgnify:CR=1 FL=1
MANDLNDVDLTSYLSHRELTLWMTARALVLGAHQGKSVGEFGIDLHRRSTEFCGIDNFADFKVVSGLATLSFIRRLRLLGPATLRTHGDQLDEVCLARLFDGVGCVDRSRC